MATIDRDLVARIAALAQLELDADALERMTSELGAILRYVAQLEELDVEGVPPTAHVHLESLPLRDDMPQASLEREAALGEAPSTSIGGFAVPTFVDEG